MRLRATALGRYDSRSTTSSTRMRVSGDTSGLPLITRETVWVDTLASEATCLMVACLVARIDCCLRATLAPLLTSKNGHVIDNGNDNIVAYSPQKSIRRAKFT